MCQAMSDLSALLVFAAAQTGIEDPSADAMKEAVDQLAAIGVQGAGDVRLAFVDEGKDPTEALSAVLVGQATVFVPASAWIAQNVSDADAIEEVRSKTPRTRAALPKMRCWAGRLVPVLVPPSKDRPAVTRPPIPKTVAGLHERAAQAHLVAAGLLEGPSRGDVGPPSAEAGGIH